MKYSRTFFTLFRTNIPSTFSEKYANTCSEYFPNTSYSEYCSNVMCLQDCQTPFTYRQQYTVVFDRHRCPFDLLARIDLCESLKSFVTTHPKYWSCSSRMGFKLRQSSKFKTKLIKFQDLNASRSLKSISY